MLAGGHGTRLAECLSLANATGQVAGLSPLVAVLRHGLAKGDVLFIEGAETHLDPDLQYRFVEILATCVARGLRVVMTTHSDWMLESLSNVVARAAAPRDVANGRAALASGQVGVWAFGKADGRGAVVKEARFGFDQGGYETGFYDVLEKNTQEWYRLAHAVSR